MDLSNLFWNASLQEMKNGYVYNQEKGDYSCIICGKEFIDGLIYSVDEVLVEAKLAVKKHIEQEHQSMFDYLLNMNKKYTGLTDHQKELLHFFNQGLSDKEVTDQIGGSTSTIRNYRFTFKEKEKQAKVFLAMMELIGTKSTTSHSALIPIHKGATMVDERYAITEEEKNKILSTYFKNGIDGPITSFPTKEKRKIVILQQITRRFDATKRFTEKEINEILKTVHSDFVTLRRYLIEYGFMERTKNGSEYWVKK